MPTAEPPLLPAARTTWFELVRHRLATDPRMRWLAPLLITLLAAAVRMWNLGHPRAIVFDETYYVKDAWTQWNLGYAATWPEGADARFLAGETDIFTTVGSFVVHPPLGKYLIGLPMALFGPDSTVGWRLGTAVAGTACVLVLYLLAKTLTGSVAQASLAAGLLAIDGLGIVMSRVALLDIFLCLFTLLAFWFVVLDRARHRVLLAEAIGRRWNDTEVPPNWGPVLWNRPWIIAAGAAAGAASAVKWSGVWVLAAVGLYLVVSDALIRRRAGVLFWPTDAVRQGAASFLLLVPVAFAVYLASWTGWLVTDGGYDRHAAAADPDTGVWAWVPESLQSLWHYHVGIYSSTAHMSTPHSYQSPALQWPLLLRPTSMYAASTAQGEPGCDAANGCWEILYSMPNPLVWWASVIAVIVLAVLWFRTRDSRYGIVFTGIAATWVPWLLFPDRTIFQFYTVLIQPFLLLALVLALAAWVRGVGRDRRPAVELTITLFLGFVVAVAVFWFPLWSAIAVPYDFYRMHNWLPGWV